MDAAKPFTIPKRLVYEAFKAVKANAGAAGVDGQSIEDFEQDLKGNLRASAHRDHPDRNIAITKIGASRSPRSAS